MKRKKERGWNGRDNLHGEGQQRELCKAFFRR